MATCGNCKAEGQTTEHVRACYADRYSVVKTAEVTGFAKEYVEARDFQPMALNVPDSRYALVRAGTDDEIVFYEVRTGRKGKWTGFLFLERLLGAPGDWKRTKVTGKSKKDILAEIAVSPKAAAVRYGQKFTSCAVCHSPLSDPASMAAGIGPICAKRF